MTAHTPTPWRMKMTSSDWRLILSPTGQEITHPRNEADSAFIVRAVNNHAALVEALEALTVEAFQNMRGGKGRLIDNAWAALKAAKES